MPYLLHPVFMYCIRVIIVCPVELESVWCVLVLLYVCGREESVILSVYTICVMRSVNPNSYLFILTYVHTEPDF